MTLPVITIRPEPGAAATVEAGHAAGLAVEAFPLIAIEPVAWEPVPAEAFDGLLLGSANAVRHAGAGLDAFRGMPAYAVGEATAAAAVSAGLKVAAQGRGGLQSLLGTLAPPLHLLRLAGEEHVPLSPPAGIAIETRVVYRAAPLPAPAPLAERLREGAVVLLHSAAAARHFASECDRLALVRAGIALAALGPRIAGAAGEGWATVVSAASPTDAALLALAGELCHDCGRTSRCEGEP